MGEAPAKPYTPHRIGDSVVIDCPASIFHGKRTNIVSNLQLWAIYSDDCGDMMPDEIGDTWVHQVNERLFDEADLSLLKQAGVGFIVFEPHELTTLVSTEKLARRAEKFAQKTFHVEPDNPVPEPRTWSLPKLDVICPWWGGAVFDGQVPHSTRTEGFYGDGYCPSSSGRNVRLPDWGPVPRYVNHLWPRVRGRSFMSISEDNFPPSGR